MGESLLHVLRSEKTAEVERLLAEGGADVNEADAADGMTPLHVAAAGGHLGWVKRLLELGARPDAVDALGKLPTHYARGAIRSLLGAPPAKKAGKGKARTTLEAALARLPGLGVARAILPGDDREHRLLLFDGRARLGPGAGAGEWLDDTFGDGFPDGYLDEDDDGAYWAHPDTVPFAFVVDDDEDDELPTRLSAILCFELARGDGTTCPVSRIPVDGTARPEISPLAPSVEALGLAR